MEVVYLMVGASIITLVSITFAAIVMMLLISIFG